MNNEQNSHDGVVFQGLGGLKNHPSALRPPSEELHRIRHPYAATDLRNEVLDQ